MGRISVAINGRNYQVSCDDGQEAHVGKLAEYVGQQVSELVGEIGQVGETRLLLMASLLVADELSEAKARLDQAASGETIDGDAADRLAQQLEGLAQRIEGIAVNLKGA